MSVNRKEDRPAAAREAVRDNECASSVADPANTGDALSIPVLPADADTLTAALAYAAAGWYVGPLRRNADGTITKHPGGVLGKGWQHRTSRDPQVITSWFAGADCGVFLHCGRSGAVVLDVDDPERFPTEHRDQLAAAPYQSTRPDEPRRGHYLFAMPPGRMIGNGTGRLGGGWGEVRGLNGVIVVAPSENRYQWRSTGPVPVLPAELADKLDNASPAADAVTDEQVARFIVDHTAADRPEVINGLRSAMTRKIEAGESIHESAISAVTGALKEAAADYYPAQLVIDTFKPIFLNAAALGGKSGKRTGKVAEDEWAGIVAWGVGQALDAYPAETRARTEAEMPDDAAATIDPPGPPPPIDAPPVALPEAIATFRKWLGADYDTDTLVAMLAAAAVERLDGDPLWLLIVSGSGNAKTETVQALTGIGATVTSALTSEAALLSATPKRDKAKDATGGLLRKIGGRGVLVIKDVTSILSMNRDLRAAVLAALREVYDGRWTREVGTDGGRSIPWQGRIAVIGAVTTAWDQAHSVIASMGDRFVLVRSDSSSGRLAAGRQALRNTGVEEQMRAELSAAAAGVIAGQATDAIDLTDAEVDRILIAADLVTLARTGVEYDYRGNVIDAHAPEMPTRFAKQLQQVMRGAVAIGVDRREALRLALRCARDSMPPLRLAIIDDLAANPRSLTTDVRKRLNKPHNTIDRQLQALHMLGVVTCSEEGYSSAGAQKRWYYRLTENIDPTALEVNPFPEMSLTTPNPLRKGDRDEGPDRDPLTTPCDISGNACRDCGATLPTDRRDTGQCLDCAWGLTEAVGW